MPEFRNVRADDAIGAFERAGGIVRSGKGDHVNIKMPNGQIVTIPRTREPINWGAKGAWPVQLIFLLAVPATDAASYLNLLASIARLGRQPDCLAELRTAESPEQILAVLRRIQIRQG